MRRTAVLIALCLAVACTGGGDEKTPGATPSTTPPTTAAPTGGGALDFDRVTTVAGGLVVPWDLAFVDARTILVTERGGRVRVVRNGRLQSRPVARINVVSSGEGGLLGIALHPQFPSQRFAYLYYTSGSGNRVSRFRLGTDLTFADEDVLIKGIPSASIHDGGRIAFGPDGMLYVSTGDAGQPQRAASRSSLAGKILRVRPDGSVPDDNPFRGSRVWSYGHRNPQGLAWDSRGRLFESEHGPTSELNLCCNDEINLIRKGGFYGWPYRAGRRGAFSGSPPDDPISPLATSGSDTWAPAGLVVDGGSALLVAALRGSRLMRFRFASGGPAIGDPSTALNDFGRLRAARFGPDGCLYLTTSNRDGRGSPRSNDDRILRICRR
ncbi:MAG: PQQ-dependent sugar dehydrogenase [Actinomycetota bacterium]